VLSESVAHRPHPLLRPYVAAVVGYRHEGMPPGVHRGLPSPSLTLIVTLDGPLTIAAHPDPTQPPGTFDALVGGMHTRPALVAQGASQAGVQISLTPLGARALLGLPAAELVSRDHNLDDVVGRVGLELTERLRAARGWQVVFAELEQALLRQLRPGAALTPELAEAWRLTTAAGGRMRIAELARRVGWSERHLGERFRAETGLSPKEAARITRFDRARRALAGRVAAGHAPDLAGLAAAAGFADQAHLTREWRAFAGLPPSRWLAAELGFFQDNRTPTEALSQS
jgi:AraC-like DNA-binding protein